MVLSGMSIRKRRNIRKKQKIELPLHYPTLSSEVLIKYKQIFIVDLQSFSNKQCNYLLNQTLFGKLKNTEESVILVIIKSKFSPKCRECGIGEKNSKLFLKDRFVKEGNGRVLFQLDPTISSLEYRKELCKHVYKYNQNIVLLTEDKVVGYYVVGSSVPKEDTEQYNQYFQCFDEGEDDHHKSKEEQVLELQNKATDKVKNWIKNRIDKNDEINLPKTIESLEKSISPFCKISHSFSNNAHIINQLRECGDIKICDTCQTCRPSSTNTDNQFYFSYLSLNEEEFKQFDWLLKLIIQEYVKTPSNLVPIPLENLNKFKLNEVIKIQPSIIIKNLIDNKIIQFKDSNQTLNNNNNNLDDNNDNSSFINDFDNISISSTLSSPLKKKYTSASSSASSSIYGGSIKKTYSPSSTYSSPIKKTIVSSSSSSSPIKKQIHKPKFSYTNCSNSNSSSSYSSDQINKKVKIKYNII